MSLLLGAIWPSTQEFILHNVDKAINHMKREKKIVRIEILDLKYSCVFLEKQIQKNNNKGTSR